MHPDPLGRTFNEVARDRKLINYKYLMMRREVIVKELRFLEDELIESGHITKRITKRKRNE